MSPASKHHNATPMQLVEHRKPDLSKMHLVPFGTVVLLHQTRNPSLLKTHKLDEKAPVGVVFGPTPHSHSTMNCLVIGTDKVIARNDFTVLRTVPLDFPWKLKKTVDPSGAMRLQRAAGYKARARHGRLTDGRLSRSSIPFMPPLADGARESATSSGALGTGTEESLPREWTINRDRGYIVADDSQKPDGHEDNPSDMSGSDGEGIEDCENVWQDCRRTRQGHQRAPTLPSTPSRQLRMSRARELTNMGTKVPAPHTLPPSENNTTVPEVRQQAYSTPPLSSQPRHQQAQRIRMLGAHLCTWKKRHQDLYQQAVIAQQDHEDEVLQAPLAVLLSYFPLSILELILLPQSRASIASANWRNRSLSDKPCTCPQPTSRACPPASNAQPLLHTKTDNNSGAKKRKRKVYTHATSHTSTLPTAPRSHKRSKGHGPMKQEQPSSTRSKTCSATES
ncbi:hypothetical protein B484DRAFT_460466, partial [Ochromonadaceae sp. CCMP2298]